MLITTVALGCLAWSAAVLPPAPASRRFCLLPERVTHIGMAEKQERFEPKRFLQEVRSGIEEQKLRLAECEDEEECMLQDAHVLEEEIKAGDSMALRVSAAKRHGQLMGSVAQAHEDACNARRALEVLEDQKRSAHEAFERDAIRTETG